MTEQASQNPGSLDNFWKRFPWWFVAAIGLLGILLYIMLSEPRYREAFQYISSGLRLTLIITITSFVPAILIGALIGMGCRSKNVLARNLAFFYLAIVGGIPTIIMIIFVPNVVSMIGIEHETVPNITRGIFALVLVFGAIYGDVFRLGLASASGLPSEKRIGGLKSVAWSAVGITFIALLKDSALVSVLAVREITSMSRLFKGTTFQFLEADVMVILLYLLLTIPIRFLLHQYERRLRSTDISPDARSS